FDVPVVALSADVISETKQKAAQSGMVGFVEKPILLENLIMAMVEGLEVKGKLQTKANPPLSESA
ncbi:MAG: hypothetical protein AB3N28_01280, partial [Kordiimonas sp.]